MVSEPQKLSQISEKRGYFDSIRGEDSSVIRRFTYSGTLHHLERGLLTRIGAGQTIEQAFPVAAWTAKFGQCFDVEDPVAAVERIRVVLLAACAINESVNSDIDARLDAVWDAFSVLFVELGEPMR